MKSVKRMFVYGTLMSGERNHKYFKDSVLQIEEAKVQGQLVHLLQHNCPTVILGTGETIGELISYNDPNDEIEKSIVALEQEFDGLYYARIPAQIQTKNEELESLVFAYELSTKQEHHQFMEGRWSELM